MGAVKKPIRYKRVGDCWICTSHAPNNSGYPSTDFNGKRMSMARAIFIKHNRQLEPGEVARHTCDNSQCINPDHIIAGTQADNVKDTVERNRQTKGEAIKGAKLRESDVLRIRLLYSEGYTLESLGNLYGVSFENIHYIVKRKTWKHI